MSESMLVRASRDGDQFHYLWAARRALQLLNPHSGLVAITIEGPATDELSDGEPVEVGEQLIDIAEYYGSTELKSATRVRYLQLKHSTLRVDEVWQPSGLKKTIGGFADRYAVLQKELPDNQLSDTLEFWFITNRPINPDFIEAIEDAAARVQARHPANLTKLEEFTSLEGEALASFCAMLHLQGLQDNYWTQRNILHQDVGGYLPDMDVDAPIRLKELINKKALSESATNPSISKMDVLRELRTDEGQLFPAPCLIETIDKAIPRKQEEAIISSVIGAVDQPVIVHADAGVGKSVFSTRICQSLPEGSVALLYDCFGNGHYRSATGYRHRHKTALVQLANELAARGLCHPLIPAMHADSSAYTRAFLHRVNQAVTVLRAQHANALLCIIVDAADNAQMAAEDIGEPQSFIRDLLREHLPDGVRLVALCRPYREQMLAPPPHALLLGLDAFSVEETATHLRQRFPLASEHDVEEFHRLSSQNPRVQALALSRDVSLPEMLRLLGPNPTTVDSAIDSLLEKSIAKLRDAAGGPERSQIDLICAGLACLRPLVPIAVLAGISGVNPALVRSFALDLGRPLIVNEDTVQFYDEPAETWFRHQFRPDAYQLEQFIDHLAQLSASSAYVAGVMPQLMLEAGQLSKLVELALTSNGLPDSGPVERRDIELQRLQFALKASLRSHRYQDAAKLALKAGGESAGNERQRTLLRENADLVSPFMESANAQELVSRRTFGSGWVGSHHLYEAVVLSGYSDLKGEARSRLRMAEEWLDNWNELPANERQEEPVTNTDRAMVVIAYLNIDGPDRAADSLRRWRPRSLSYQAGCIIARRLLDHGQYGHLDALAIAAGNDVSLVLGLAAEARDLNYLLTPGATGRVLKLLNRIQFQADRDSWNGSTPLSAVTAFVEIAYRHGICDALKGQNILARFLPSAPPAHLSSRFGSTPNAYLKACALQAAFLGQPLKLIDVAASALREEMQASNANSKSQELQEFEAEIGVLIPWVNLWAQSVVHRPAQIRLSEGIALARSSSAKSQAYQHRDHPHVANEIANLWIDTLLVSQVAEHTCFDDLVEWLTKLDRPLFTPTLNRLARLFTGVKGAEHYAFQLAETAASLHRAERSDARHLVEGLIDVARSLLAISPDDAQAYFDEAIGVASKIGDENFARWGALIDLAERAADEKRPAPEVAYNFARCAEVTRDYVDRDKHFAWNATIKMLVGLCPSSALAVASRWRDRHFGDDGRILKVAISAMLEKKAIQPADALPLIGFRAQWDEHRILAASLREYVDYQSKEKALRLAYRYMGLRTQTADQWQALEHIATSADVCLPGLSLRISETIERERSQAGVQPSNTQSLAPLTSSPHDWDAVFENCDISTMTGLSTAHQRFRKGEPPIVFGELLRQVFSRVQIGKEASLIGAFAQAVEFTLWDLRSFLENLPPHWKDRPAIRNALVGMLKVVCRRHCMEIRRDRYFEIVPFDMAYEASGIDKHDLLDAVLGGIGESMELAESDRLFSLVGLLSQKLTNDEALDALAYGLKLFESVLEPSDGDGAWNQTLAPPAATETALAGYIWSALASPSAATRWEAAHVVVGLCALGRTQIINELFAHAASDTTIPYGDARFAFYNLHAHQWLLIAASRAALEHATLLIPHLDYLQGKADLRPQHVMIQLFAARTLMTLIASGLVTVSAETKKQMAETCGALGPGLEDGTDSMASSPTAKTELNEDDRYGFGWDFEQYWLAPLGRCFGMSQIQISKEAQESLRNGVGYTGTHRWKDDARNTAELLHYEDTSYRHSSYPRADSLSFYSSYHAMMMTAGRLRLTKPQSNEDRFIEWLARHDLTRPDGRWIADRRDPEPLSCYNWPRRDESDAWLRSMAIDDFDRGLFPGSGLLTIWGDWSGVDANYTESISVHSALVSPSTSSSLLRAIQTAKHPHDFRIPSVDDELEIDTPPYLLKGWVQFRHGESGIDDCDPWAGNITFPAPEPAGFVVDTMNLSTDLDRRDWFQPSCAAPVMCSHTWGSFEENDHSKMPKGYRLEASVPFIIEYLKASGKNLIVEVEIQRSARHQNYRNRDDDELRYLTPSNRIYLFKNDGTVQTLRGDYGLGEKISLGAGI